MTRKKLKSSSSSSTPAIRAKSKKPKKPKKSKKKNNTNIAAYYDDSSPSPSASTGADTAADPGTDTVIVSVTGIVDSAPADVPVVPTSYAAADPAAEAFNRGVAVAESTAAFNRGVSAAESVAAFNRGVSTAESVAAFNRGVQNQHPPQVQPLQVSPAVLAQQAMQVKQSLQAVQAQQGMQVKQSLQARHWNGNVNERVEMNAGFIFFCSEGTKLECFTNRVFGLPHGRLDFVQRIRPGAKLFLYDFSVKLMYGVYRAIGGGGLNLVPGAFGGKFPAQVQFDILEDCIPVHERVFRSAIEENYEFGSRFKPDLSSKQVQKLCALFKPVPISVAAHAPAPAPAPALVAGPVPQQLEQRFPGYYNIPGDPYRAPGCAPAPAPAPALVTAPVPQQLEQRFPGYYNIPRGAYGTGNPVRAPPAVDAGHVLHYGSPAVDARHGLHYGPSTVDALHGVQHGPPAVVAGQGFQYAPPAVDAGLPYRPPAFDNKQQLLYGGYGSPAADPRHGLDYGSLAVGTRPGLQYTSPGLHQCSPGLPYGPPVDSQYRAAGAHYPHGPPGSESMHASSAKAYHRDPYYDVPDDRQTEVREYNPTSHGQSEHYLKLSGGVSRDPPPPVAPGRDYQSLTTTQLGHSTGAYEDPNASYSESNQTSIVNRINTHSVPVSSRYAFAGAPSYR